MSSAPALHGVTVPHSRPSFSDLERTLVAQTIDTRLVAPGKRSREFGEAIASMYGARFGLALNSCTSALHLVLMALGVKAGDRVGVPALVCPAVLNPIRYVGGEPVLLDVRRGDHHVEPEAVRRAMREGPLAALILPHRYGHVMDVSELSGVDVPIIEDAAHSLGAGVNGSAPRLQGVACVFSFYATKMLSTGCGGALVTNDERLARRAETASAYYPLTNHASVRYNYRMPDLNAAMGLAQLRRFHDMIEQRRACAARYGDAVGGRFAVVSPSDTSASVWYRFIVRADSKEHRHAMLERSERDGCGVSSIDITGDLPVSRAESDTCVSLPIYPDLGAEEQRRVIACVSHA